MAGPFDGHPDPDVSPASFDEGFLREVRVQCIKAAASVSTAMSVPRGPHRAEQAEWARQNLLEALGGLVDERFWDQLHADDYTAPLPELVPGDVVTRVQNLFSDGINQVLLDIGYRPPPPAWVLVGEARGAVEAALVFGQEPNHHDLQRTLRRLIEGLDRLHVEADPPGIVHEILRTGRRIAVKAAAVAGTVLWAGTVTAVGAEYVFPTAISVLDEAINSGDNDQPEPRPDERPDDDTGPERPADWLEQALAELRVESERQRLRAIRARADLAELELKRARNSDSPWNHG